MKGVIALAAIIAAVPVTLATVLDTPRKNRIARALVLRRSGYNCCEACGVPLGRHAVQTWRYDGVCRRCGRVQIWASDEDRASGTLEPLRLRHVLIPYRGRHRAPPLPHVPDRSG